MILYQKDDITVQRENGVLRLWIGAVCQGQSHDNNRYKPVSCYMTEIQKRIVNPKSILFIGLGAGILPSYYHKRGVKVEVIEPRADVCAVARDFFKFRHKEILVYMGYAEDMLQYTGKYDYIVLDAHDGFEQPMAVYCQAFQKELQAHLNEGGELVINTIKQGCNVITSVTATSQV